MESLLLVFLILLSVSSASTYTDEIQGNFHTSAFITLNYTDRKGIPRSDRQEIGEFGEWHVLNSRGHLLRVLKGGDDTGCQTPWKTQEDGWIALIRRGNCSFQTKIENAVKSNASGVIIFNEHDFQQIVKMSLSYNPNKQISAVLTTKTFGDKMIQLLNNGFHVTAQIEVGSVQSTPFAFNHFSEASILMVILTFVFLMTMSLVWLVIYYIQRHRLVDAKNNLSRRMCSAAKQALSKIPMKQIKVEDKESTAEGDCCPICIEGFKPPDLIRMLPCKHEFHLSCIDPWLLEHRTCPMCKMDILKYYGYVFTGSQESILDLDPDDRLSDADSVRQETLSPIPGDPDEPEHDLSEDVHATNLVIDEGMSHTTYDLPMAAGDHSIELNEETQEVEGFTPLHDVKVVEESQQTKEK